MKKFLISLSLVLMFSCASTQAQNYKTHKVKSGETIEAIAKQYLVTPYDIYALNPDAKNGLKPNTVLIIPKSKVVSKPKVTIVKELEGFKKHKVKRRETLFSLSQKYNVEQDDIKKHNPFLYSKNLRKGDRIKIPIYKIIEVVEEVKKTTKSYTVLPKEGKWRIAYKYGITIPELEALNPNMNAILKEGEIINVPNLDLDEEKEVDEKYSYYKVLPKEGFYRLKIKIGLEKDQLEALNPGLSESGLKEGMILKVPFNASSSESENSTNKTDLTKTITDFEVKHIAIMLPFKLHRLDLDSISDTKRQLSKDPYLRTSINFYSGALVALDSLKKLGVSLKVDVYDTKNQLSEVSRILNTNDFMNVDAVIGPFMTNNFQKVASELSKYQTPVISPIGKQIKLSENVFQSRPSEKLLKDKIVNYVKNDSTINQVIIISDAKHTKTANSLKTEFANSSLVFSRKNKKGKEAYFIFDDDILDKLKPGNNVVFLETDNSGFVSNVTSKLNAFITDDIKIVLMTTNKTKAFENDEVSNYHLSNLQFHFPSIAKAYNQDDNNRFVKTFKKRFGETPNKIAVRGFDLTMDIVLRLVNYNDLYSSINEAALTEYVENKFAYKKKLFGGYYNNSIYLVKYQDLQIVEAK